MTRGIAVIASGAKQSRTGQSQGGLLRSARNDEQTNQAGPSPRSCGCRPVAHPVASLRICFSRPAPPRRDGLVERARHAATRVARVIVDWMHVPGAARVALFRRIKFRPAVHLQIALARSDLTHVAACFADGRPLAAVCPSRKKLDRRFHRTARRFGQHRTSRSFSVTNAPLGAGASWPLSCNANHRVFVDMRIRPRAPSAHIMTWLVMYSP